MCVHVAGHPSFIHELSTLLFTFTHQHLLVQVKIAEVTIFPPLLFCGSLKPTPLFMSSCRPHANPLNTSIYTLLSMPIMLLFSFINLLSYSFCQSDSQLNCCKLLFLLKSLITILAKFLSLGITIYVITWD